MKSVLLSLLLTLRTWVRSRAALQLEVLALWHQLQVLRRTRPRRVQLAKADRWLWVLLSRIWAGWRTALVIVKPETVIAWHRQGFRLWWGLEEPAPHGTTDRASGRPRADSYDGAGKPALGRAADSWRTAETRDRRLSGDRREIHCASAPAAIANVAHLLYERS